MATANRSQATTGQKASGQKAVAGSPPAERIATRAYEIWVARGCPQGQDTEHWLQAERELGGKPARR
jgi:hypothetical protein